MYCEHCGLQIFPKLPVCTRCGETPTFQLFQLASLFTLFLAVLCNSLVAWLLLPRLSSGHYAAIYFRVWLWLSDQTAIYGWAPIAIGLLVWDYFVRRKTRQKIKGWLTRKLLSFVIVAGAAEMGADDFEPRKAVREGLKLEGTHIHQCGSLAKHSVGSSFQANIAPSWIAT